MRCTTVVMVGLLLAGAGTGMGQAQDSRQFIAESQAALRKLAEETNGLVVAPPQENRDLPHGGGIIRGIVTAAASSAPVPGAVVRAILETANASAVTTATDEHGAFEFRGLTPGRWRISAFHSGFLPRELGQRGRSGQGSPIDLKDRATATANIALLRGGAIAGHVFDEFGDPAVGISVQVTQFTRVESGRRLVSAGVADTTDDTGAFRVYGLPPGDYLVSARSLSPFDRGLRLTSNGTFVSPTGNLMLRGMSRMSLPTYFPGTPETAHAATITLEAGAERTGVNFTLISAAPVRVSGTVVNSSGEIATKAVTVSIFHDSLGEATTFMLSGQVRDGAFTIQDVPPGPYVAVATVTSGNGQPETAEIPFVVGAEGIEHLEIVTAPGVSLTGSVEFENGGRQSTQGMTLAVSSVGNRRVSVPTSTSVAVIEGVFQIRNLRGPYRLNVQRPPTGWSVKSIEIDGQDVTDEPFIFTSGRPHATVVLTNRVTDLGGTVTHDRKPVDADVLIFPDDPAKWTAWRYVRSLRADAQGTFSVTGMPPHDGYLALATTYLDPDDVLNPDFLALARSRATSFSLGEGQSQRLRLTLVDRSELDGR